MNTVITNVYGGLGNQMFQYAAGRALAFRCGAELMVDLSDMNAARHEVHNGFELSRVFGLDIPVASSEDLRRMLGLQGALAFRRFVRRPRFGLLRSSRLVVEPHFHYWDGLAKVRAPSYLHGFWQSARYFEPAVAELRADFRIPVPDDAAFLEQLSRITASRSVSLHIRRGDYVRDAKTASIHGSQTIEFYRRAAQHLQERYADLVFFVFSDDLPWVKSSFDLGSPTVFVEGNTGPRSYLDLLLMSRCKHNVIANSTFSWWGGWLNENSGKTIVAPRRWFADPSIDTSDLDFEGMVRL